MIRPDKTNDKVIIDRGFTQLINEASNDFVPGTP